MRIRDAIRVGKSALRRNVLRTALTTLGILIGVAAVIAMIEIGQGSSKAIKRTIETMGANYLSVAPGAASSAGVSYGSGSALTLTPEDAQAIKAQCPSVQSVAPVVRARSQVTYQNRNWIPWQIYGTTPEFLNVRDWLPLARGYPFTDQDVRNSKRVCIIGATVARELFGTANPIEKEIRIQNVNFRVIGVLTPKGSNMMGFDQDDTVLAPWTTIKFRVASAAGVGSGGTTASSTDTSTLRNGLYPATSITYYPAKSESSTTDDPQPVRFLNIDQISVATPEAKDLPQATEEIKAVLRERHRIRPDEPEDFSIRDTTEMTQALASTSRLMTNLLLSVALISLVVGGVGIMNVMLVSVTERTKEIGLRMAVGATPNDILKQFLIEALMLSGLGGLMGILFGRISSYLVHLILRWPIEASPLAVVVAAAVSAAVGTMFGFYPAWKASKMDPIEALRYE